MRLFLFFNLSGRKKKKASPVRSRNRSKSLSSRSPSPSPPRSILSTPPPSSSEDLHDDSLGFVHEAERSTENVANDHARSKKSSFLWEVPYLSDEPPPSSPPEKALGGLDKKVEDLPPYSPLAFNLKPAKDKHNKLRETIEKLKAKSEISRYL